MKYVIVNTKNKLDDSEITKYYEYINTFNYDDVKFIICPLDNQLNYFKNTPYCLGAQSSNNINLLMETNVTHCICGHYNDRVLGINDEQILKQINLLQANNIKPIFCIGDSSNSNDEIIKQLSIFKNINNKEHIIVAYEPYQAIGTNNIPSINFIENKIKFINSYLFDNYKINVSVVYGGSVNKDNIDLINNINEINGVMISSGGIDVNSLKIILDKTKTSFSIES